MRALLAGLAVLLVACGGDDPPLEEWLGSDDGGRVEAGEVPCVAEALRGELSDDQIDEIVGLDTGGWSDEDYAERPVLMGAVAEAAFACETS